MSVGRAGGGDRAVEAFFRVICGFLLYDETNLRSAGHLPLFTFLQAPALSANTMT